MNDEILALQQMISTQGWDLFKQMEADDKMMFLNKLSNRSKERKDKQNDEEIWGIIKGMNRLISRVEREVEEAAQRNREDRLIAENNNEV